MTTLWLALWMLAGAPADEGLRVADEPRRVCLDAPRALFRIENAGEAPVLVALSIERWSGGGDAEDWTTIQQDVTERDATVQKARSVKVEARGRRDVAWVLKGRKGPALATGRHRLVASVTDKDGRPASRVFHEFVITDCSQ
jgi:hypothetical protein